MKDLFDLIIIGAGPAGLIAAQEAAGLGLNVLVLDGNKQPGKKLLMAGGGRCNVTNAKVSETDFQSGSPRIVRHVLKHMTPSEVELFFMKWGKGLKLEDDGKYFSKTDSAADIVSALLKSVEAAGAKIRFGHLVNEVSCEGPAIKVSGERFAFCSRALLIATGGLSYPSTGSTGFGFKAARVFGHKPAPTRPALVPLTSTDKQMAELSGLAVPCRLTLWSGDKKVLEREGDFLVTHRGFSGPAVLDVSGPWLKLPGDKKITANFCPDYSADKIEKVLTDVSSKAGALTRLAEIIPRRLAAFLIETAGADPSLPSPQMTREVRKKLVQSLTAFELPVTGALGFEKAEITSGGVDLNELTGPDLQSQKQPGLFFAGEVLDVDGRVGGFNLQWAWASGVAAARGVNKFIHGKGTKSG